MEKQILSAEESLSLISKTIEATKQRFAENGHILVFWGLLTFVASSAQFILYHLGHYSIHWYPAFLYPLGAVYMVVYMWKKYRKENLPKTLIGNILSKTGWFMGLNFMVLGFIFSQKIGDALAPVFLILLAFFIFVAGISIKFRPLIISGIALNLFAFASLYVHDHYLYLVMALGSFALTIPGILLSKSRKKHHV